MKSLCPFEMAVFYCHLLQIGLKILHAQTSESDQSLREIVIKECEDNKSKQVQIDFLLSNTLIPRLVFFQKSRSLKTSTIKQLSVLNCQHCVGTLSKNNKIVIISLSSLQLQKL